MNSTIKKACVFPLDICKKNTILSCYFTAAVVIYIDYITGREIRFPILYVLPVSIAAWVQREKTAYTFAFVLPVLRVFFIFQWKDPECQSLRATIINFLIRMGALLFYAYLVGRTARQTKLLEKRVKILEGIVPICASCKKIRNEKGEYVQVERYVSEHSEASFSHGICPECMCKLYPEFYEESDFDNTKS